jgi:hypothetical protein
VNNTQGFRLTKTDKTLIERIAAEGFLSFQELRQTTLKTHNRTWAWEILKRLVNQKYLDECRGDEGRILGWRIKTGSKKALSLAGMNLEVSAARGPVYRTSFEHDRQLRSIKRVFKSCNAIKTWMPEHELKYIVGQRYAHLGGNSMREKLLSVPDAVLSMTVNGMLLSAALELEITQKSRKRLYQKIENYVTTPDYRMTFYVAKDERIRGILQSVYHDVLLNSLKAKVCRSRNGIYFSTLEDLEKNGENACFYGLKDTITLKMLS